ncbi:MAG: MBL fold metallo-hydrolase [Balneolaceae bacterium]
MQVESFTVGPFAENSYLLLDGEEALIVDPGFSNQRELEIFLNYLKRSGARPIAILLTHAHVDHVLGLSGILRHYDLPVWLSDRDRWLWKNAEEQAALFGIQMAGFHADPEPLPEGKGFQLGSFTMDVIDTPGHSPDHVSLYFPDEGVLVSGDALFRESIGRTDLYKGRSDELVQSIREKLYPLPDETVVWPGHGPSTTIGHEKSHNPFVNA